MVPTDDEEEDDEEEEKEDLSATEFSGEILSETALSERDFSGGALPMGKLFVVDWLN